MSMPSITAQRTVFETDWFRVVEKDVPDLDAAPFYSLHMADYVSVVALTKEDQILLVRQFRPAVGHHSIELPSGHVEPGETPEEAAHRELLEETGHRAGTLHLMGNLCPDTGRYEHRLWCYFVKVEPGPGQEITEPSIELLAWDKRQMRDAIMNPQPDFDHALNFAALTLALVQNRFNLDSSPRRDGTKS